MCIHSEEATRAAALSPNTWSLTQRYWGARADRSSWRMSKLEGAASVLRQRFVMKRRATSESR